MSERPRAALGQPDLDWKDEFLETLRRTGMVTSACAQVGIARQTAYDRRKRDEEFAREWGDVLARAVEVMERELFRRAVVGVSRPVFQQGRKVGEIREYSDNLLMFMLKKWEPSYREHHQVEHVGAGGEPLQVKLAMDAEQRQQLRELLRSRPVQFDAQDGSLVDDDDAPPLELPAGQED